MLAEPVVHHCRKVLAMKRFHGNGNSGLVPSKLTVYSDCKSESARKKLVGNSRQHIFPYTTILERIMRTKEAIMNQSSNQNRIFANFLHNTRRITAATAKPHVAAHDATRLPCLLAWRSIPGGGGPREAMTRSKGVSNAHLARDSTSVGGLCLLLRWTSRATALRRRLGRELPSPTERANDLVKQDEMN